MLGASDECDIQMNLTPPEKISGYTWRLKGVHTCLTGLSVLGDSHHIDEMLVEYKTLTNPSGFERTSSYQTDAMVPQLILIVPTGFDVSDADVPVGTNCGFWQTEHMPTLFSADLDDEDFVEQEGAQNYAISFQLSESATGTVGIQERTSFHDVTATWYAVADA